jgi:peroxiredoxin
MADVYADEPAPDFVLTDTDSRSVRLSDYRDEKHVVLVFNRGMY